MDDHQVDVSSCVNLISASGDSAWQYQEDIGFLTFQHETEASIYI